MPRGEWGGGVHVFTFVTLELLRSSSPAILLIEIECKQYLVLYIGGVGYDRIRHTVPYT